MLPLPKWLFDGIEKTFPGLMHPVTVRELESVDEGLQRVVFEGDLSDCRYQPGQVIDIRVSDREMRHYTPSEFDRRQGRCEVLVYLHGDAVGTRWVRALHIGQQIKLMGPEGRLSYRPAASHHLIFGDESSLGLARALQRACVSEQQRAICLLELEQTHQHWPELLALPAQITSKSQQQPGQPSAEKLESLLPTLPLQEIQFYLTGRAQSIQRVLRQLREQGVKRAQIQSDPYWADAKQGL